MINIANMSRINYTFCNFCKIKIFGLSTRESNKIECYRNEPHFNLLNLTFWDFLARIVRLYGNWTWYTWRDQILGQYLVNAWPMLGQCLVNAWSLLGMESHSRDLGMNSHSFLLKLMCATAPIDPCQRQPWHF